MIFVREFEIHFHGMRFICIKFWKWRHFIWHEVYRTLSKKGFSRACLAKCYSSLIDVIPEPSLRFVYDNLCRTIPPESVIQPNHFPRRLASHVLRPSVHITTICVYSRTTESRGQLSAVQLFCDTCIRVNVANNVNLRVFTRVTATILPNDNIKEINFDENFSHFQNKNLYIYIKFTLTK